MISRWREFPNLCLNGLFQKRYKGLFVSVSVLCHQDKHIDPFQQGVQGGLIISLITFTAVTYGKPAKLLGDLCLLGFCRKSLSK